MSTEYPVCVFVFDCECVCTRDRNILCVVTLLVCAIRTCQAANDATYKYDALPALCVALSLECVQRTGMMCEYNIMRSRHYAVRVRLDDV